VWPLVYPEVIPKEMRKMQKPILENAKKCSVCKQMIRIENFHKSSCERDGLSRKCKRCQSAAHLKYREKKFRKN